MKNFSARKLAVIISVVAAVFVALAMWLASWLSDSDGSLPGRTYCIIALTCFATFVVAYLVLHKVFDKVGLGRERIVYGAVRKHGNDTMNDVKSTLGGSSDQKSANYLDASPSEGLSHIISQVNDDVAKWAEDTVNEITILRNTEKFRREYIGNVSHELKTPLNNIQGYIETLIDGGLQDEEINLKYLNRADRNISRLISIVEDLDTISKFESGMLKLNIEDFDVLDVVEEVLEFNENKASAKHISLKLSDTPKKPVMVRADKGRIYEVINNLVVNSINYGNENGYTKVSISDIENKYLIDVKDNGIGIAADNIGRVFERFFRVDKSRSRDNGGTGLGLAIVKHIMEAHNELVTVKSKIGEGSTFSITLKKA
ncbi:MAG: sensor histidine kinase [Bacteroidales bacterium]|nr:sensor histidine kinase [Bacteroidales bacterium]